MEIMAYYVLDCAKQVFIMMVLASIGNILVWTFTSSPWSQCKPSFAAVQKNLNTPMCWTMYFSIVLLFLQYNISLDWFRDYEIMLSINFEHEVKSPHLASLICAIFSTVGLWHLYRSHKVVHETLEVVAFSF